MQYLDTSYTQLSIREKPKQTLLSLTLGILTQEEHGEIQEHLQESHSGRSSRCFSKPLSDMT